MTDANEPPAFDIAALNLDANGIAQVTVAENTTAVGTVAAADPDAADTGVTYTLRGTDAALFSIGADGAIAFKAAPDFEDPKGGASDDSNVYAIQVWASAGVGARNKENVLALRITVTDVSGGAPAKPAAPTAVATAGSLTSLDVSWTAPANEGPAITDYDVQYRQAGASGWTPHTHTGTATSTTIAGLTEHQAYEVQVRAENTVGESDWSDLGQRRARRPDLHQPRCVFGEGARHRGGPGAGARPGGAARPRRLPPAGRWPRPRRRRRRALRPRVRRRAVVPAGAGLREPA